MSMDPTTTSGARFFTCALQVNSAGYLAEWQGKRHFTGTEDEYVEAVLQAAVAVGVNVIAVTDHHDVAHVSRFEAHAKAYGIIVFPGFEATTNDQVHVLCLYAPGTPDGTLREHLGALKCLRGEKPKDTYCNVSFVELLDTVRERSGIAIAAHVDEQNGLLVTVAQRERIRAWKHEALLAVATSRPAKDIENQAVREILLNRTLEYRRDQPVAIIGAQDVEAPEAFARKPRTRTLLKMTTPTLEGLKQAFLDPESRVKDVSAEQLPPWPRLVSIRWERGFLDGAHIRFNENLNVLIGSRGTGKTAIIESIRYALDLPTNDKRTKQTHEAIISKVIEAGTKVTLEVNTGGPSPRTLVIERTVPDPPRVTEAGAVVPVHPKTVFPHLDLLGQGELSELAKDKRRRTDLLDRFLPPDGKHHERRRAVAKRLVQSREQILGLARDLDAEQEAATQLEGIREKLRRFEGLDLDARLAERTTLARERQLLDEAAHRIAEIASHLDGFAGNVPIDRTFLSERATADLPGRDGLNEASEALHRASDRIVKAIEESRAALTDGTTELAAVRARWAVREAVVEKAYAAVLEQLKREGVRNAPEFMDLRDRMQVLEPRAARVRNLTESLSKARAQREQLLKEWDELLGAEFDRLKKAQKRLDELGRVRISLNFRGDRTPLVTLLQTELQRFSTDRLEQMTDAISPRAFAMAIRKGARALTEEPYRLTNAQATKLIAGGEPLAMLIEELDLPVTTDIEFDATGSNNWQTIEQLSEGQRASAILMILLASGPNERTPLVVDQPEDDLDNHFVFEGIVPQLKRAKQDRQFLFATHNANIPVLGDAELIVALDTRLDGKRVVGVVDPARMGSIDVDEVRRHVEEILEGGRQAFLLRKQKYHF